jgi:hypothetical protein
MKVDNEVGAQNLAMINKKNNTQEVMFDSKKSVTVTEQSINKVPQEISLSTEGKLTQAIDKTSDEIDDILIKHITPDQKKELTSIYSRLDDLFAKEKLTDKVVKSIEALFEQVHVIFESGIEKLTKTERNEVEKLSSKMDKLTSTLEKNERVNVEVAHSSAAIGNTSDSLSGAEIKSHKKTLTVAELNALSAIELNKLSTNQLKKLNSKQLNKLNAAQLNTLPIAQLKHLSPNNVDKLNQSQANKLATA